MHVTERVVGDVVILDVSGKVTLGDGGAAGVREIERATRLSQLVGAAAALAAALIAWRVG